jgi:hypothetical protein
MNRWKSDVMTALQDPNGSCDMLILDAMTARLEGAEVFTTAVDVRTYVGVTTAILMAIATTAGTLAVKLQDSANGSTGWADIVGAAFASVTAGPSAQRLAFNVGACRGFVRLSITVTGALADYDVGVVALAKRT